MKIALLVTCLGDALFPQIGRATVALLERLGHEVVFPAAHTWCGQMHVNTAYQREVLPLVRHPVEVFEPRDVVVAPSGSCGGSVRHQHAMMAHEGGDDELGRQGDHRRRAHLRAVGAPRRRARRRGRRRLLPAPRDLPPHAPIPTCSSRRQTAAAVAAGPVFDTAPTGIPDTVRTAMSGVAGFVLIPDGWLPPGAATASRTTAVTALDAFAGVVTGGSAAACAETGTIALDGAADQDCHILSLLPDLHVCVVRAGQVVRTVPELLARLDPTRLTLVSGLSATSDIEPQRVEGVHGPRTLVVVLVVR